MRGTLDFGNLHIPVFTYARVKQVKLPSLSKRSALGSDSAQVGLERFKTQRTAEGEEVVPEDELVKAYAYGKDLFTVDDAQQQLMKYTCAKELAVLAFIPRSALRVHWFLDTVETVTPEPGDAKAYTALASLAEALATAGKVGLCRFVPRANAAPQLVALLPPDAAGTTAAPGVAQEGSAEATVEADKSRSILYLVSLPFAEDLRDFAFPALESLPTQPSQGQMDAAAALIDALDLDSVPADADEEGGAQAGYTLGEAVATLPNPTLQRLADTLAARAAGDSAAIAAVPAEVEHFLQPSDALFVKAGGAIAGFEASFPLAPVTTGKRSREAFGGEADMDMFAHLDAVLAGGAEPAASNPKAPRTDAGAAGSSGAGVFSSLAQTRVREIGTVQPQENLVAMLAQGDAPERVIGMFIAAINSMLQAPSGVDKALQCLQYVRPLSIQHAAVSAFNSCLGDIRSAGQEPLTASSVQKQAWAKLQGLHLRPISVLDAPSVAAAMAPADADAFYAQVPASFVAPSMTQSGAADAGDADSDLDELS
jgi:hypothetical protein